jgi:hypothetical protein
MKHLTLRKNGSEEAMKRLTLLKTEAMKRLTLHRCIASLLSTLYQSIQKLPNKRSKTFQDIYVKAKTMMFFGFASEIMEITNVFGNCPWNSSLLSVNIFFVKALRQRRQIREVMKR